MRRLRARGIERRLVEREGGIAHAHRSGSYALFDHLGELRMRLVRIVACLAIAVVVFYMATPIMGQFLLMPIAEFLPVDPASGMASLQAIDPFEAFSVRFEISLFAGLVATSPVILWQILAFFLPALKPKERKWFIPRS